MKRPAAAAAVAPKKKQQRVNGRTPTHALNALVAKPNYKALFGGRAFDPGSRRHAQLVLTEYQQTQPSKGRGKEPILLNGEYWKLRMQTNGLLRIELSTAQQTPAAPTPTPTPSPKKQKKDYPTVGTVIEAKWSNAFGPGNEWYRGKIAKVHAGKTSSRDPSFDVTYNDGEFEERVMWENIRVVHPSTQQTRPAATPAPPAAEADDELSPDHDAPESTSDPGDANTMDPIDESDVDDASHYGRGRRGDLPRHVTATLLAYYNHTMYPTYSEYKNLARETGLSIQSVRQWFGKHRFLCKLRASQRRKLQWTVGGFMAIWAVGITLVLQFAKVVRRDEVLWPLGQSSTVGKVVCVFLNCCVVCLARVIATAWARATMAKLWRKPGQANYYGGAGSAHDIFGETWSVVKKRKAGLQQQLVLVVVLWTYANILFFSVAQLKAKPSTA